MPSRPPTPLCGIVVPFLLLGVLGLGCGAPNEGPPPNEPTGPSVVASVPAASTAPDGVVSAPSSAAARPGSEAPPPVASAPPDAGTAPLPAPEPKFGPKRCRLPEPRLSDDACTTDADCGPSEPCHAPACVAKSKSNPPGPGTMCTRILRCDTADANRCGCYQGRCALIPPNP